MTRKTINPQPPAVHSRKRSIEWPAFQAHLATVLESMQEDEFLIISHKHSNRFVQFAAQGGFGLRAETTGNAYLDVAKDDPATRHLALQALGWKLPTGTPDASTPSDDPDGSPNCFIDFPAGTPATRIAQLSVHTLADLYEIAHPGELEYDAFDDEGAPIEHPVLRIAAIRHRKARSTHPAKRLLKAVIAATGVQDLAYDEDGHLCVRFDDTLGLFILLSEDAAYVHIMSVLATDVTPGESVLAVINALNDEAKPRRFLIHDGSIIAMLMLPAQPLIGRHVERALSDFAHQVMTALPTLEAVIEPAEEDASGPRTLH